MSAGAVRDAFAQSSLLSALRPDEVAHLCSEAVDVILEPGDYLFRQGDDSDSVYVVTSGVLSAILESDRDETRVVGSVRPGETVGEVGVLANAPRSLSITARSRSTLLKIPAARFERVCLNHPALLLKVVHVISERNRDTIRVLSPFRHGHSMAILPMHASGLVERFLQSLREQLTASGHFDVSAADDGSDPLARGERPQVRIVGAGRSVSADLCVDAADRVLLVADAGGGDARLTETAQRVLEPSAHSAKTEKELVLVRDQPPVSAPAAWVLQTPHARRHHARAGDAGDLQRLIRHLRGRSVIVVLSGGGLRGWVHLGVLRALESRSVPIDGIGGSSIGAVVAACWLATGTAAGATASFGRIAQAIVQSKGVRSLTYPAVSILNGRRWTQAIRSEFGDRDIEDYAIPFFTTSCNLSRNEENAHRHGRLWEAVRASSSLPALVPPFVRDGQVFIDGGIVNNLPVDIARAMMGGSCRTIAVELSGRGELDAREYQFPPVMNFVDTLLAKLKLRHRNYRFISIGELVLRALTHGSTTRTGDNLRHADIVVQPAFPNQGFLSAADPGALVDLGHRAMLAELDAHADLRAS